MVADATTDGLTVVDDLRVGELLAEGGEGKVFELPLRPHLVYKQYRRPASLPFLEALVSWPRHALGSDDGMYSRVRAASAWPDSVVVDSSGAALGLLVPRAPRRFSVRHRDGTTRLSSLSYLTADPAHRAVAYGLDLPEPGGPERLGLVYALARLLEAFESGSPSLGHGDLSTKNVLWSLQRGPEIYVIDCDNCERFDAGSQPLGDPARRRAMTPNWDDPAVPGGSNPTAYTDRYSLALIFLRVVGAANFPVQARQRDGGTVTIDFPVPPASFVDGVLGPDAPVWDLCRRGLSLSRPGDRPPASEWVAALGSALGTAGANMARAVHAAQAGDGNRPAADRTVVAPAGPSGVAPAGEAEPAGSPESAEPAVASEPAAPAGAPEPAVASEGAEPDVVVRPVRRDNPPDVTWKKLHAAPPPTTPWLRPYVVAGAPYSSQPPGPLASPSTNPILPQVIRLVRRALAWWVALHVTAVRLVFSANRRRGAARAVAACAGVDLAVGVVGLVIAAMIAAPLLGI